MSNHYTEVIEKLKEKYEIERYFGQTVYKLIKNGFVYLRFSSRDKSGKEKYFFGLEKDAIRLMIDYDFCIIFVCGISEQVFIIPKDTILLIIEGMEAKGNQWKINIFGKENEWYLKVTGKDRFEISKFKNKFDFIFTRIIYEKLIGADKLYKKETEIEKPKINELEKLKSRLITFSTKSSEPQLFEEVVADYFRFLGCECEHIGGPSSTDVLINKPFKVIVEVKTSKRENINKINFTRLKQHKLKYRADYILVVSNDFAPAVIRDAEIENAILVKTDILCKLLDINRNYPISSQDLEIILRKTGLITEEHLEEITVNYENTAEKLKNIPIIIESIDITAKNSDEIYGRYQLKCEEMGIEYLNKNNFKAVLDFLALPFIDLINFRNNNYSKNISNDIAIKRLKIIGGLYGN